MNLHHELSIYLFGKICTKKEVLQFVQENIKTNFSNSETAYFLCKKIFGWEAEKYLKQITYDDNYLYFCPDIFIKLDKDIIAWNKRIKRFVRDYKLIETNEEFNYYEVVCYNILEPRYCIDRTDYRILQKLFGSYTYLSTTQKQQCIDAYIQKHKATITCYIGSYKDKIWTGPNKTLDRVKKSANLVFKNRIIKKITK